MNWVDLPPAEFSMSSNQAPLLLIQRSERFDVPPKPLSLMAGLRNIKLSIWRPSFPEHRVLIRINTWINIFIDIDWIENIEIINI